MHEKVSVVIATYNGEAHLKDQLTSIFTQLPANSEVIISDNGSTDNTIKIISDFDHPAVKLFVNNEKKGVTKNFENALRNASGDIIFLSDQDDVWLPNKIEVCMEVLQTFDTVVSNCTVVDENLEVIIPSMFGIQKSEPGIIRNFISNNYMGSCMAFKKSVLELALPFPSKIPMHDIWLGFVSELFFKSAFIEDRLILYRRHLSNSSNTGAKSNFDFADKIGFRWNVVRYLPLLIGRRFNLH
jgi:glycosyltransferase involved in cell wall biosynthesis